MSIVKHASRILLDSKKGAVQSEELARICSRFANKRPAVEASLLIVKILKDGTLE